jgi:hypothetical protein
MPPILAGAGLAADQNRCGGPRHLLDAHLYLADGVGCPDHSALLRLIGDDGTKAFVLALECFARQFQLAAVLDIVRDEPGDDPEEVFEFVEVDGSRTPGSSTDNTPMVSEASRMGTQTKARFCAIPATDQKMRD